MAKRNYISNSTESTRMFKSDFLESLTKVHYSVPIIFYLPVIIYFSWKAMGPGEMSVWMYIGYFVFGLAFWTIFEYALHRWVFHYHPKGKFLKRVHWIFHGIHHDYPKDRLRLVMPLSASIPLATLVYFMFSLFFSNEFILAAFFAGFMIGYLIYDESHYAMHHANFKSGIMKRIKQHHMLHHYQDPEKGFGVSSAVWDVVFDSGFEDKKEQKSEKEQAEKEHLS
ncbi:sterol desaturase family protein [Sphingobacterium spiritivorum]|uniref:sterol desaturase family protein n=1 Tax=Sphingobacterium spiritivorum TaxID=258 RepID=UPI003DA220CE